MTTESKSLIRKTLEALEDDIHKSWLRDLDKVTELHSLHSILEQILAKDTIEEYFPDNLSDFNYFINKFSHETIHNILRQPYVFGPNGDDVAFSVLLCYLRLFLKFWEKPQYTQLWESVKEIFDNSKSYYKGSSYGSIKVINEKKIMSSEKFNESIIPASGDKKLDLKLNDFVDVLIENKRPYNTISDKRIWTRGVVTKIESDNDFFIVHIAEDTNPIFLKFNSLEYLPVGTMTKDFDWRQSISESNNNLDNIKDVLIDCMDRGRWFPSTVLYKKEEIVNGLKKIDYRIGFRVYPSKLEDKAFDYKKFWQGKSPNTDSKNQNYYGDNENLDEWIPSYSKRIQKHGSHIFSDTKSDSFDSENYFLDELIKFNNEATGKKTYVIGRSHNFSYYFSLLLIEFAEFGGFEKLIDILSSETRPSGDLIHFIFIVFSACGASFHRDYVKTLGPLLQTKIFKYLNDMNQNELRTIKKDTLDIITRVLKFYLGLTLGAEERNRVIEEFSITFSLKMIKTAFLEKRIQAVKNLVDVIRSSKSDPEKSAFLLKLIEDNHIFTEIYGSNSHFQLINMSKDLLEILLKEDKLSDKEMEMIWTAAKKGDFEEKLTILKILKEISKSLTLKHVTTLLDKIYASKSQDWINEEIDLIFELSTHSTQNEETVVKCMEFFTNLLLTSTTEDGDRINMLINKIFEIIKSYPTFKSWVVKLCLENLEKVENSNLALKLLQKFLKETNIDVDFDLQNLLINNNKLNSIFCQNFTKYTELVKERSKGWTQDIDLLPIGNFTHSQNLKARLDFINTLITLKLWGLNDVEPIDFLYEILVEKASSEKDKQEFYQWIRKTIETPTTNANANTNNSPNNNNTIDIEDKIFSMFKDKICKDQKSCQKLSIQAFESYLKVFLNINQKNNLLKYSKVPRESKYEITSFCCPDNLMGFDILWKIVFESFSNEIMNKGIEILHDLYTNIIQQDQEVNNSQHLLKRCITMINETVKSTIGLDEKHNIIKKCLLVLKLMIEESEKRGTARVKSHFGLQKRRIIKIKVTSLTTKADDCELLVYGNTTMWDLKEIIALKVKVCVDFIKLQMDKEEISNTMNGKTVLDMRVRRKYNK